MCYYLINQKILINENEGNDAMSVLQSLLETYLVDQHIELREEETTQERRHDTNNYPKGFFTSL